MEQIMKTLIIILAIFAVFMAWMISVYNKLIAQIEAIKNNKKQIDIQLDRRFKVFESLINVVKKYMDYERTTLKDVVALRNQAVKAAASGNEQARIDAENSISKIASGINVVFERYPELKADRSALQLQEEIVSTENKLTYAKQAYNDSIEKYNAYKKSFLQLLVIAIFSRLNQEFPYWGLSEETVAQHEKYTVQL
jgi:LemA protein